MFALLLLPIALQQGCRAPQAGHPGAHCEGAAWDTPTWGQVTRDLQCRLQPTKRLWGRYETPTFRADIRNLGRRVFALPGGRAMSVCEVSVDGRPCRRPHPAQADGTLWPLAPGVTFENIAVSLDPDAPGLAPGEHIVQVTFELEGIRVVSNPVGIEILQP